MVSIKKIFFALTRRERVVFVSALSAAGLACVVLLFIFFRQTTTIVPARGGAYTEGIVGQPTHVNPVLAASEADKILVRLLFSSAQDVAEKIDMEKEGRVWKLRLKEDLAWSDGEKLTSDDIIFTVQKIQDPETQSPLFSSWQGVTANRLSELEVQFNLVTPYPFFEDNLKDVYILPKHLYAEIPSANWRLSEYNLQPVGSGPYEFDTYEKQANGFIRGYHLQASDSYSGEKPLIEDFNLTFFANNENLLKAFNSGSIDGFAVGDPVSLKNINRPYQLFSYILPSYYAVFFNQSQNLALQDEAVRRALSLAVDRQALTEKIFNGRAIPVSGPVPLVVLGGDLQTEGVSSTTAGEELDAAGWKLNADGKREKTVKKTAVPLSFILTVPDVPFLTATAEELQKSWSALGANVELNVMSPTDTANSPVKNRDYQALLYGNVLNPPEDLYSFWHSSERFYPGFNLSLYNSKEADQLIESIRRGLDAGERQQDLQQLQDVISSDYPAVFLYSPNFIFVTSKSLHGVEPGLLLETADRLQAAAKWFVKTARSAK